MPQTLSEIAAAREQSLAGTAGAMLTLFASASAASPERDLSLAKYIEDIRSGTHADQVDPIRLAIGRGDRDRAAWLKRRLPAVTLSCSMVSRSKEAPVRARTHSGWLQADFDAKENPACVQAEARAFLAADPHVGAVFVGPSGVGIKAAVRIDPASHAAAWAAASAYFLDRYGLQMDTSTKDVTRLCFVSHDPDAWLRPDAATVLPIPEAILAHPPAPDPDTATARPAAAPPEVEAWTMADVRELLSFLPPRPDYDTWLRIASGVFSVLPFEAAITCLNEWSPEEKPGEYALKHRNRLEHVTIRTVIHYAQAHGFDARAAARRQRWMGRLIFYGGQDVHGPGATPAAPHADLLTKDDEPELDALDVWARLEDEQIGDSGLFLAREGANHSYDALAQCWRRWMPASGLWERDIIGVTSLTMSATCTEAYEGLIDTIEEEIKERPTRAKTDPRLDEIERLKRRCSELRRSKAIRDVMSLACKEPKANRPATAYDRNRHLLAVGNGVLDFEARLFRQSQRDDFLSLSSPVLFDPAATCPHFDTFLERAFDRDSDLIAYWWRIVGYSLTGLVDHDALFFCYGTGANGKSTAFMVLRMLMGDALSTVIDVNTLLGTGGGSDATLDYKKSMLEGKRLVLTDELPDSRKVNESLIKSLLGGEDIVARRPYEKPYTFSPTHKIWMVGNHKPKIVGTDHGIWRRMHLIPWLVTIPTNERKPRHELLATFRRELPGILNASLAGYQDVLDRGNIDPPKAVLAATEEYRSEEDSLGQFIAEKVFPSPDSSIPTGDFFQAYRKWCEQTGEAMKIDTANKLTRAIQRPPYNLPVVPGADNIRGVKGYSLAPVPPQQGVIKFTS